MVKHAKAVLVMTHATTIIVKTDCHVPMSLVPVGMARRVRCSRRYPSDHISTQLDMYAKSGVSGKAVTKSEVNPNWMAICW